jgi:8-oxo-dGTP pyrophosphatase MutT (NUDIX family)
VRLKLIACETLYREVSAAVARSAHRVDIEFLPKGLHARGGAAMREHLRQAVERADTEGWDAILLGYGLCGNGVAGLASHTLPLVIPRAHDCIALLMGGRERYQSYFERNPGVYFRSTGWLERGEDIEQTAEREAWETAGPGCTPERLIARYGEDSGRYLFDQFTGYRRNYRQLTYIATGLECDGRFEERARDEAERRGWRFDSIAGDLRLFEQLVSGVWPENDFLVVPPGWRVKPTYDGGVIDKEPAS